MAKQKIAILDLSSLKTAFLMAIQINYFNIQRLVVYNVKQSTLEKYR